MVPINMDVEFESYMNKIMALKQQEKDRTSLGDLTLSPQNQKLKEIAEIEALEREKVRQEKITNTINYILSGENPEWLENTRRKAEQNSRSLRDQARLEAEYVTPRESANGGSTPSGGGGTMSSGGGGGTSGGGGGGY